MQETKKHSSMMNVASPENWGLAKSKVTIDCYSD
jgi:hypothetical protein